MSLPENDQKQRALKREWAAARVVVIGGIVVAIGVAGYFVWRAQQERLAQAPVVHATTVPPKVDQKLVRRLELTLCTMGLVNAQGLGMVPQYATLATPRALRGTTPGRFICEAKTDLTHYFISADLKCSQLAQLTDARCVSVYRVALKDGRLIYSRPPEPGTAAPATPETPTPPKPDDPNGQTKPQ
jgi:hypothetical protein